jgi:CHAT domain-containing protein/Tfp pilus assembly protein PilF
MKQNKREVRNVVARGLRNLRKSAMGWLLTFSLLLCGCGEGLAASASQQPVRHTDARRASPDNEESARALRKGGQAKSGQSQANNQESQCLSQIGDVFELLKLAFETFLLSASQTPAGARESIKRYKEAFAIYKRQDVKLGMAATMFSCGAAHYFLGENREALNAWLEASEYSKDSGLDVLRPFLDACIGTVYASLGETAKALECLERSLPMIRAQDSPSMLAMTLRGMGEAHMQLGQKRKGLEYLNESLGLYRQTGEWLQETQILSLISALQSSLGQSAEALKLANAAVKRAKEKGARDWLAYGYFAVGAAYTAAGNLDEAVTAYNRSLELLRGQHDGTGEATAFNNLGLIYVARGDFNRALKYFEKAWQLAQSSHEPRLAAYVANNMGTIYARRGNPVEALRSFKEALDVALSQKDKRLEAAVLSSMADTYFLMNGSTHALKLLREAAESFAAVEEPGHESESLISLADGFAVLGQYKEALAILQSLLASEHLVEDPGRQGYVLREMAYIYNHLGEPDKELQYYAQALAKLDAAGDDLGKVDLYTARGATLVAQQDYQQAEEQLRKGLAIAQTAGLRQNEVLILAVLGLARARQGECAQAEIFYDQGVNMSEALRSSARIEELKTGVGNLSAILLAPAIQLKFKLGKFVEAFELSEKARARTFLDQMNQAHINVRKGGDPKLLEQEQALRFAIGALEEGLRKQQRENPSSEVVRAMAASLKEKHEAYGALLIRLKASHPDYAELQGASSVSLTQIQQLLEPQTTLISYFVTTDESFAFIISRHSFQAVEIPAKEADLRATINWFRAFSSLRDAQPQSLKQLHDWLIAPIRQHIKTPNVIIVPHGILHYVPFAALNDGQEYFADAHAISYLPSASLLPVLKRRLHPAGRRVFAAAQAWADGLPVLRFADQEVEGVAKLFGAQALPTGRATRALFLKRSPAYSVLHIAAHAELNDNNSLFSRLRLSPDKGDGGALEIRELYGLNLSRTDLAVLSACQTQLGAQSKGDDIVSLNRAFIYAGASSVIASLWTVDDQATSLLMQTFYGYLKQGLSKAEALQAAQAATRRQYPHPYYWAAFVLTGDPGKSARRPKAQRVVKRARGFR